MDILKQEQLKNQPKFIRFGHMKALLCSKKDHILPSAAMVGSKSKNTFAQVLWGTNTSMKADLDKRHIKEDQTKEKDSEEDTE